MKIIVKKGEPLWTEDGFHVLNESGFAVVSEELYKEIHIKNPEAIERIKKTLPRDRWDELYILAMNSSEQFLKDKELELNLLLNKQEQESSSHIDLDLLNQQKFEESKIKIEEQTKSFIESAKIEMEKTKMLFEQQIAEFEAKNVIDEEETDKK